MALTIPAKVVFKRGKFQLDADETPINGWTRGELCNGWEVPYFELQEAQKIATLLGPALLDYCEEEEAFYSYHDGRVDQVIYATYHEPGLSLYCIAGLRWLWFKPAPAQ